MRKSCVQPVGLGLVSSRSASKLSTGTYTYNTGKWRKDPLSPTRLHKLLMQLYASNVFKITDVVTQISPLSTPLIIRSMLITKETLLYRTGG